jgi:ribosomal-protein-alanine N-acetyltransferase
VFVERAGAPDAAEVARLLALGHSHPWTLAQVEAEISQRPPAAVLLLRAAPDRAACASCAYRVAGGEMEVLDLTVHPRWRGRGLARALLRLALRRAARAGATRALLEVRCGNAGAIALYRSLGFEERGRRRGYYREPVEDALLLARDLAEP